MQRSICGVLVAVGVLVPASAGATILTRCGSLADLKPLADASTLSTDEQAALGDRPLRGRGRQSRGRSIRCGAADRLQFQFAPDRDQSGPRQGSGARHPQPDRGDADQPRHLFVPPPGPLAALSLLVDDIVVDRDEPDVLRRRPIWRSCCPVRSAATAITCRRACSAGRPISRRCCAAAERRACKIEQPDQPTIPAGRQRALISGARSSCSR